MKTFIATLLVTVFFAARLAADPVTDSLNAQSQPSRRETKINTPRQFEVVRGSVTYGGAFVQVFNTKNRMALFTPAEYGNENGKADYNLDRDIITGRPVGFKLFTITFGSHH